MHVGDEVTIENQDATAGEIRGKIQYVAPALDPTTRTLQARIEANNPREQLKKDMSSPWTCAPERFPTP